MPPTRRLTRALLTGVAVLVVLAPNARPVVEHTARGPAAAAAAPLDAPEGVDGGWPAEPAGQGASVSAADWSRPADGSAPAPSPAATVLPARGASPRTAAPVSDRPGGQAALMSRRVEVGDALWAAYRHAVATSPPGCHLPVELLAAIGEVESGSLAGRRLDAGHRPVPPVQGPVLDGNGYAAIRDTDQGRWDGDTVWDRAVGPMQFIPGTWQRWGRDGDDDGIADPQDVDDAAVAAAVYLCAAGGDLSRPDRVEVAILAYNHSRAYLRMVLSVIPTMLEASTSATAQSPSPAVTVTVTPPPRPAVTVTQTVTVTAAPPPPVTVTWTQVSTTTVTATQVMTQAAPAPTVTSSLGTTDCGTAAPTSAGSTTGSVTTTRSGTPVPPTGP